MPSRHVVVGGPGHFLDGLELLGRALQHEAVEIELDVVRTGLEQMRGDLAGFLPNLARGPRDGGARHGRRARAVGAEPIRRGGGIAFFDRDHRGRNAGLGGDDLRIGGLMALALA